MTSSKIQQRLNISYSLTSVPGTGQRRTLQQNLKYVTGIWFWAESCTNPLFCESIYPPFIHVMNLAFIQGTSNKLQKI